ncbi:MAG: hypothetical protein WC842_04190 [Candidatus Paceibacterota bacterium]
MEQYQLLKRSFFSSLQKVLSHSSPTMIFVRFMGSRGGNTVLRMSIYMMTLTKVGTSHTNAP